MDRDNLDTNAGKLNSLTGSEGLVAAPVDAVRESGRETLVTPDDNRSFVDAP